MGTPLGAVGQQVVQGFVGVGKCIANLESAETLEGSGDCLPNLVRHAVCSGALAGIAQSNGLFQLSRKAIGSTKQKAVVVSTRTAEPLRIAILLRTSHHEYTVTIRKRFRYPVFATSVFKYNEVRIVVRQASEGLS